MGSMVTLLVSTKDRPEFVRRQLRYYADLGFQGHILIGDSSGPDQAAQTRKAAEEHASQISIDYGVYPGMNYWECLKALLDLVQTKYVAMLPDDDFIVPRSLERCARFLETHSDYTACQGVAALLGLESGAAHGVLRWANQYRQRPIEGKNATERLLDHLSNYSVVLFALYRVATVKDLARHVPLVQDRAFCEELLPNCLSVILGKVKKLDSLHLVRQSHSSFSLIPDLLDWIASPDWLPCYQIFRESLALELVNQDKISLDEATEVVKQAFWGYLAQALASKWWSRYALPGRVVRSKRAGLRLPATRWAWLQMLSFLPGERNQMMLPAIIRRLSPYHADFMPVYRAVTGENASLSTKANDDSPATAR